MSTEVALALAVEDVGEGYCGVPDYDWPCVIPTDVTISKEPEFRQRGRDYRGYRYCFNIEYQAESTLWDSHAGRPREPRNYFQPGSPARQCAWISYWRGDETEAGSWRYSAVGDPWFASILEELTQGICGHSPQGPYLCPSY